MGYTIPTSPPVGREEVPMASPRGPQAVAMQLTEPQRAILEEMVRCRTRPQYEVMRATIILQAAKKSLPCYIRASLRGEGKLVHRLLVAWGVWGRRKRL